MNRLKDFKIYLKENKDKGGLTIFDIDETLMHTTAKVGVVKNGKTVRELNNQEYNTYRLKPGEEYDYRQFRNAKKFRDESKPIKNMFEKAKAILRNVVRKPNSRMIIVTARNDFDDKEVFLDTFRKHGLDIDKVRVERAGKIPGYSPAVKKAIIINNYLATGQFGRVRLFDDALDNLREFLKLQRKFRDVKFEAYFVTKDGTIRTVK